MNLVQKAKELVLNAVGSEWDHRQFPDHAFQVYYILRVVTEDEAVLCAGILHDMIEDGILNYVTDSPYQYLCDEFNQEIADLVMEVTHEGSRDNGGYYFPRLKSHKAIIIKFADRLSNLCRIEGVWDQKRIDHYLKRSKFWKTEL